MFIIQKENNNNNTILLPADGAYQRSRCGSPATAATVVPARVILGSEI